MEIKDLIKKHERSIMARDYGYLDDFIFDCVKTFPSITKIDIHGSLVEYGIEDLSKECLSQVLFRLRQKGQIISKFKLGSLRIVEHFPNI